MQGCTIPIGTHHYTHPCTTTRTTGYTTHPPVHHDTADCSRRCCQRVGSAPLMTLLPGSVLSQLGLSAQLCVFGHPVWASPLWETARRAPRAAAKRPAKAPVLIGAGSFADRLAAVLGAGFAEDGPRTAAKRSAQARPSRRCAHNLAVVLAALCLARLRTT